MTVPAMPSSVPALQITDLTVAYGEPGGEVRNAVLNLHLTVQPGEIHALVGESGAGKSTVGNALMGLLHAPGRIVGGSIAISGRAFDAGGALGIVPGKDVGAIFQDPLTSLNPLFTVESQLTETMRFHLGISRKEARGRALELLRAVGIPEPERRLKAYPHQLSGGQRQRVVIAAALCCNPKLVVADEPTTALDVSAQAQILALVRKLADERQVGVLLITHNMGVVAEIADRVTIMKDGRGVESGPVASVLGAPQHAYARSLIDSVPRLDITLPRLPVATVEPAYARPAREAVHERMSRSPRPAKASESALVVDGLTIRYSPHALWAKRSAKTFVAVDDVSFAIGAGEIFGLVGESGCGKTTLANAIAGLITPSAGTIHLDGRLVGRHRDRQSRKMLQMVFQDPYSSLNPRLRVGGALAEPIRFHGLADAAAADEEAALLLEAVGLDRVTGERFPHAFSGGQRQRIAIARALASRPRVLVCDEPTSSLDVSVQAQILNLLKDLRDLAGPSILFISHDLAVVRQMCDRIAVMKDGKFVELADTETLFRSPQHDYTRKLLSLVPALTPSGSGRAASWATTA